MATKPKIVKIVISLFRLIPEIRAVVKAYKGNLPDAEQEAAIAALCDAVVDEAAKFDGFVAENKEELVEVLTAVFTALDNLTDK